MTLRQALVEQFGNPRGALGRVAGLIMRLRRSNRERNRRTLELLQLRADDEVLEIGFGPGLAIEAAAQVARKVVGIDRSELMVRQARRRNARAIAQGKVELLHGASDRLAAFAGRFDKAFAINVYMFWSDPAAVLREVRAAMKPNGTLCLTLQPRLRTSSSEDTRRFAEKMAASLHDTGFANVRSAILAMAPVDTACVLGEA